VVLQRLALSTFCGALLSAALPAVGLWPLLLALLPLFVMVAASERAREAFWLGFSFALGFFVLHILWLPSSLGAYSGGLFWILFPPMLLILGGFWGLVTYLSRLAGGRGAGTLILLPALWVLMEWLRSQGALAFPWGFLGYAWLETPLAGLAALGGVYGLSFLSAVFVALLALPALRWAQSRAIPRWPLALAALLGLGSALGGQALLEAATPPRTHQALLVQGATDPFGRAAGIEEDLDVYVRLTRGALMFSRELPELIVWPEGVVSGLTVARLGGEATRARIAEVARGATVVTGGSTHTPEAAFNSVYSLYQGEMLGRFDKVYLVPFGESAPLADLLLPAYQTVFGWFGLGFARGITPGEGLWPLPTPLGDVAAYICYESVFPQVARTMAADGARVLVNISNDAWFGRGRGAEQHFAMGRLRAIETGRYLLRVGNDGITALVTPRGEVVERLPRGPEGTLLVDFALIDTPTPYVRYGDRWLWGLVAFAFVVPLWRARNASGG
jgi:apolipoprotein N-acyltransferase